MIKIALDYDETYTLAEDLFNEMIAYMQLNPQCYEVKFVTLRDSRWENSDIEAHAANLGIDIIYSNGKQKVEVYDADIWIDDHPAFIPDVSLMEGIIRSVKETNRNKFKWDNEHD